MGTNKTIVYGNDRSSCLWENMKLISMGAKKTKIYGNKKTNIYGNTRIYKKKTEVQATKV